MSEPPRRRPRRRVKAMATVADAVGVAVQAVANDDSTRGFQVVFSRKFTMRRGVCPDPEMPAEDVKVCENEVPWFTLTGSRRKVRKCYQSRKGSQVMSFRGLGFYVFGSYGANSLEF